MAAWLIGLTVVSAVVFLRPILGLVFGRRIAAAVMAKQPRTIRLVPASASAAPRPEQLEASAACLMREGFTDAGWFTVSELPGVALRMLVHEREYWQAVLHDYPAAGRWLELIMVFPDRSRMNFVGRAGTGLAPLPTIHVTYLPGHSTDAILKCARAARAKRTDSPVPASAAGAAAAYEQGFAEVMALRMTKGISRLEVAAVALRADARGKRAA